jgi:hypothetical protein
VAGGEPAGNGRTGQVDDGVNALESSRIWVPRIPSPFIWSIGTATHEADDPVTSGREQRTQRPPHQTRGAGDTDRECPDDDRAHCLLRHKVLGQLAIPKRKQRLKQMLRHRGVDDVSDHGAGRAESFEVVFVAPAQRQRG